MPKKTSVPKKTKAKVDAEPTLHEKYFKLTEDYHKQYGPKMIVLMLVGVFFEMYGLRDSNGEITGSIMPEMLELCGLEISELKVSLGDKEVIGAGFRDYSLDKYLSKIIDMGYTVPLYIQNKDDGEITRVLDKVYSPGTYLTCDTDSSPQITNNIMCIWIETFKPVSKMNQRDIIVYGASVVNMFTGKSYIFQYETAFYMNTTTFDELVRFITIHSPSETILVSPFDESKIQTVIQYSGLSSPVIHKLANSEVLGKPVESKIKNCSDQKYIKAILNNYFGDESYELCQEFNQNQIATQSLCYMLNFIKEHNPELVKRITMPDFNNTSEQTILANHTLMQLNIINDDSMDGKSFGKLSSVSSLLNKCCSPMGRRTFHYQITNPTFNEEWLNKEYDITHRVLTDQYHFIDMFRKQLSQMRDIEKICRQLVIKKLYPSSIFHLHKTVGLIQQMNVCLSESPELCDYLCDDFLEYEPINQNGAHRYVDSISKSVLDFLNASFIIDKCKSTSSMMTFGENIIRTGVSEELDQTIEKYNLCEKQFNQIQNYLESLMKQTEKKTTDTEYVKVHQTEKSGASLQITTKRSTTLDSIIKSLIPKTENGKVQLSPDLIIPLKEIKFIKASSSSVDIVFPQLTEICKTLLCLKDIINGLIARVYLEKLLQLEETYYTELQELSYWVSKIDVLQSKVYVAKQYNYCRPEIVCSAEKSFFDSVELRHCLIEHLQKNEIYVTNDVLLGKDDQDGFCLYGTNAVGKTSLTRSVGIALIMAQAGIFVPCSQFRYKPYKAIFSRILGNDNIFKGLSTFAVEMSELRLILKMADKDSLILGDELCSGTEMESALSIFVAGLMDLHEKRSTFIFATHFHEIIRYDEVKDLTRLHMKHMTVFYDREQDCLVYDRKLKDGSGMRMYGLEVCKALHLEPDFLNRAHTLRNKYYPDTRGELSSPKTSYNSNKIRDLCEMCGKTVGEETHHLRHQSEADEKGFIGSFSKNHPANLMSVCKGCHDKIHDKTKSDSPPIVRKKTTKGFILK
jgi:DNA mismatch repair protein MutS